VKDDLSTLSGFQLKVTLTRNVNECEPLPHGCRCRRGEINRGDPLCSGRTVQVDPINPTLKALGTKRLKLKCDEPLSNFAFKFNLRRYTLEGTSVQMANTTDAELAEALVMAKEYTNVSMAGAYTRPLFIPLRGPTPSTLRN